ncbi:hypothetical protein F2Q69_00028512 [Brassica cretica]|uniref:Uncharacterized protein n=1 Tax=Brassica cretica TaxID=69181 RepID=A0A8S9S0N4_BRACR|nr:hypothetical protein F2Q69_00028512 [Brassica cretica]
MNLCSEIWLTLRSFTPNYRPDAPPPPFKCSCSGASFCQLLHDTERFQFINSIGKGPLGAHVKHVIEILLEAKHGDNYPAGAAAVDLNVAYRMSWRICSTDSKENIVYPNNFKPQNELLKIGLKPVMNTTQRRAAA